MVDPDPGLEKRTERLLRVALIGTFTGLADVLVQALMLIAALLSLAWHRNLMAPPAAAGIAGAGILSLVVTAVCTVGGKDLTTAGAYIASNKIDVAALYAPPRASGQVLAAEDGETSQ